RWVTAEVDHPVVVGASREHRRVVLARPFDENVENPAAIRIEMLVLVLFVSLEEAIQSLRGNGIIDGSAKFQRRRAGPRRVLEREQRAVANLFDQRQRLLEVVIGLAGKSDDDVSRKIDRWNGLANARDRIEVALPRIEALHP